MVARAGRKDSGEFLFNGHRVQFCKMKNVLEINGGAGCTTVWM